MKVANKSDLFYLQLSDCYYINFSCVAHSAVDNIWQIIQLHKTPAQ